MTGVPLRNLVHGSVLHSFIRWLAYNGWYNVGATDLQIESVMSTNSKTAAHNTYSTVDEHYYIASALLWGLYTLAKTKAYAYFYFYVKNLTEVK